MAGNKTLEPGRVCGSVRAIGRAWKVGGFAAFLLIGAGLAGITAPAWAQGQAASGTAGANATGPGTQTGGNGGPGVDGVGAQTGGTGGVGGSGATTSVSNNGAGGQGGNGGSGGTVSGSGGQGGDGGDGLADGGFASGGGGGNGGAGSAPGAAGGNGGNGGGATANGTGGIARGGLGGVGGAAANGSDGATGTDTGSGSIVNNTTLTGNAGGAGTGGGTGGSGGNGGSASATGTLGTATGGFGGNGGAGGDGGNGGNGGIAIVASGATITNTGTIQGGSGGAGGVGGAGGNGGDGGLASTGIVSSGGNGGEGGNGGSGGTGAVAISGSDLTIINSGTIAAGLNGTGGVGGAGGTSGLGGTIGSNGNQGITSTSTANAITFTGGTNVLQLQPGSIITGNVVNNGDVTLQLGGNTGSATFDVSQISGTGQYQGFGTATLEKVGNSTWTLTGTSGFGQNWRIKGGTLAISADNNLGTVGHFTAYDGGTLRLDAAFTLTGPQVLQAGGGTIDNAFANTLTGQVTGAGSFTKTGAGTLTLTNAATDYTGATTVLAGTLALTGDASLATSSGVALNGGTLDISGTNAGMTIQDLSGTATGAVALGDKTLAVGTATPTTTFAGTIGGTVNGGLTKQGSGTLILSGTNSYGGITTITDGTLALSGTGSLASSRVDLTGSGVVFDISATTGGATIKDLTGVAGSTVALGTRTLTLGTGNSTSFDGAITGTGGLVKQGNGTLTLNGANSYTGGTTLNAGILQLGTTDTLATTGALTVNGGTLEINGFSQTVASLSGAGGTINLINNQLTVNNSEVATFAGAITGSDRLTKTGTGTLVLSGANTFSGLTLVNDGVLVVNGSIGGNLIVNGGTLQGTGTLRTVTVGGTIAPGNSIGTLTVTNNYTQLVGSTYQVEVNSAGQSDRIVVAGTASLAGTLAVQAAAGTYARNTSYTVLTAAGGLGGTSYSAVTTNFAFLTASLSYTPTAVLLTLISSANSFQSGARTPNQMAVATALDLASPTASGDFATVLNAIYGLDTTQGPAVLNALGGQVYSGFSSLQIQSALLFMDSFQVQAGSGSGDGGASLRGGSTWQALKVDGGDACETACDIEPLWGAWGGGVGAFGTIAGNSNTNGLTYNLGGFVAGLDRKFAPSFRRRRGGLQCGQPLSARRARQRHLEHAAVRAVRCVRRGRALPRWSRGLRPLGQPDEPTDRHSRAEPAHGAGLHHRQYLLRPARGRLQTGGGAELRRIRDAVRAAAGLDLDAERLQRERC